MMIIRHISSIAILNKWHDYRLAKLLWTNNTNWFGKMNDRIYPGNMYFCRKRINETYEEISFRDMARKYPELWVELL